MTVDDLKNYYGVVSDAELARVLKKPRGSISRWRHEGISCKTQAMLQVLTNGKLKADLKEAAHA